MEFSTLMRYLAKTKKHLEFIIRIKMLRCTTIRSTTSLSDSMKLLCYSIIISLQEHLSTLFLPWCSKLVNL